MTDRLLSIEQVSEATTLGKTILWGMVKAGEFPQPRQISARRRAWLESEVVTWMHDRPTADQRSDEAA